MTLPESCDCDGRGYLTWPQADGRVYVERCDGCEQIASDELARWRADQDGQMVLSQHPGDPEDGTDVGQERGYLYTVQLIVCVELTSPPDHPDLKAHLAENVPDCLTSAYRIEEAIERYDLIDWHSMILRR